MSRLLTKSYWPDSEDIYSFDSSTITSFVIEPDLNVATQLVPCSICNRTFNPVTLRKHVAICEKMATKKRNVFDSSRQRREGTELAAYIPPKNNSVPATHSQIPTSKSHRLSPTSTTANNNKSTRTPPTTPTNFTRDALRTSRHLTKQQTHNSPTEQCPHCERCFGLKAYDRHVEWCKEKALQAAIKQNARREQNLAKERLEARIKYRAPLLKTKRSMNREKYAIVGNIESNLSERAFVCSNINNTRRNTVSIPLTSTATVAKGSIKNRVHSNKNKAINKESQEEIAATLFQIKSNSSKTKTSCRQLDTKKDRNAGDFCVEQEFHIFGEKCNTSNEMRREIDSNLLNEQNNIKPGVEKVPLKIKSAQGPTMNHIMSRKRQQKEQTKPSTPLKAMPLLKETMELFGLSTNKKPTSKNQDLKTSIPTGVGTVVLTRNKSFVLSHYRQCCKPTMQETKTSHLPKALESSQAFNRSTSPINPPSFPSNHIPSPLVTSTHDSSNANSLKQRLSTSKPGFSHSPSNPHRSPTLITLPKFMQNQRPAIQRGISDEGPISSNFLKTEEYDEIPVRAICVNDFKSPINSREIQRNSSISRPKNSHKNNLNTTSFNGSSNKNPINAEHSSSSMNLESLTDCNIKPTNLRDSPVTAKELKDKSNIISKHYSSKYVLSDPVEQSLVDDGIREENPPQNNDEYNFESIENERAFSNSTVKPTTPLSESTDLSKRCPLKSINKLCNLTERFSGAKDKNSEIFKENLEEMFDHRFNQLVSPDLLSDASLKPSSFPSSTCTKHLQNCSTKSNLRRKMNYDRNQFLYDMDSSVGQKDRQEVSSESEMARAESHEFTEPDIIIPPSFFTDFDYEEFFASIENDSNRYLLLKTCTDFLTNSISNKTASTTVTNYDTSTISSIPRDCNISQTKSSQQPRTTHHPHPCEPSNSTNLLITDNFLTTSSPPRASSDAGLNEVADWNKNREFIYKSGTFDRNLQRAIHSNTEDQHEDRTRRTSLISSASAENLANEDDGFTETSLRDYGVYKLTDNLSPSSLASSPVPSEQFNLNDDHSSDVIINKVVYEDYCSGHEEDDTRLSTGDMENSKRTSSSLSLAEDVSSSLTRIVYDGRETMNLMDVGKSVDKDTLRSSARTEDNKELDLGDVSERIFSSNSKNSICLEKSSPDIANDAAFHFTANEIILSTFDLDKISQQEGKNSSIMKNLSYHTSPSQLSLTDCSDCSNNNNKNNKSNSDNASKVKSKRVEETNCNVYDYPSALHEATEEPKYTSFKPSNCMTTPPDSINNNTNPNHIMSTSVKKSQFCHECGTKFIIDEAKFCMNCGIRRIVI